MHGDEYGLESIKFKSWKDKVAPTCKEHGVFNISPIAFLYKRHGCPMCKGKHISKSKTFSKDYTLLKFNEVHGDEYDYSLVDYKGMDIDVSIICKKHGEFRQTPYNHIRRKCGCPSCKHEKLSLLYRRDAADVLKGLSVIHNGKYKYPKLYYEYVNNRSIITAVCQVHGEFKIRLLNHQRGQGCSLCNDSKLEREISSFLIDNGIEFERQKRFGWLGRMSLDFYLPRHNVAIECQGVQHFESVDHFGGDENFRNIKGRDITKNKLCLENGVKIIYYADKKFNKERYIGDIYCDKDKLLEKLLELQ